MAQAFAVIGTYPYRQAEPDDRSRGHEPEFRLGDRQRPAAAGRPGVSAARVAEKPGRVWRGQNSQVANRGVGKSGDVAT